MARPGLAKATPKRRKKGVPVQRKYVGIDLDRRGSVMIWKDANGELLLRVQIDNDPNALAEAVTAVEPADPRWLSRSRLRVLGGDVLAGLRAEVTAWIWALSPEPKWDRFGDVALVVLHPAGCPQLLRSG